MAQPPSLNLSWLGGGVGGLMRSGRSTNEGGSSFGGQRTALKDFFEGSAAATDERFASEAKKARSLRTYLGELDPTMKDKVQAMGLGDLEGHAMKIAEDKLAAKQKLNEDYMKAQIAAMNEAGAARTKQANANQLFGNYAGRTTPPSSAALSDYYDTTSAENPNRPQPTRDILGAYFRAQQEAGAAPDIGGLGALMHYLPGQQGSSDRNRQFRFTPIPGTDATLVSDDNGSYASVVQGVREGGAGQAHQTPKPSTLDTEEFRLAAKAAAEAQAELDNLGPATPSTGSYFPSGGNADKRKEAADKLLRAQKKMESIRKRVFGGTPTASAPAPAAPASKPAIRFQLQNGELVPAQ